MKSIKSYSLGLGLLLAGVGITAGLSSCQDDFDTPQIDAPVATISANATIAEFKAEFWKDDNNYAILVEPREDGSHWIVSGRVISSDEQSNVFKSLVIQDETAALAFSINSYNLYLKYRVGQEIVVDLNGMYVGKYNGLQQMGMRQWYEEGNAYEVTFMAPETFSLGAHLNGWPEPEKIDTLVVNSFAELASNPTGLQTWQSQLVRFNNVSFQNGGLETFSTYHSSGVNQVLIDATGAAMNLRTSGYSTFWNNTLPTGSGDVVAICSYYGTSGWQLLLNDLEGCMNFGNPTIAPGNQSNPYTVDQAVEIIASGATAGGWVKGFIAGAVAPDVETVTSSSDIEWSAPTVLANTLVIAPDMDTRDINKCLIVALPSESALRTAANLRDNPDALGKEIALTGNFGLYMGMPGLLDNLGTTNEFIFEGNGGGGDTPAPGGDIPAGSGTQASPWNASQVIAGTATGTGWMKAYIVGFIPDKNFSEAVFSAPATAATNIIVAASPSVTDYNQCVPVQLPVGSVRSALNLQDHPENLGKVVSLYGSFEKYFGAPGIKSVTDYEIDGGGGSDVPDTPAESVTSINENFDASTNIPAGWTQVQVAGNKSWYVPTFNGNNYAAMTGYKGTAPFDQWLVTPPVDMSKVSDKSLTFETQVNGYGSTTTSFEVYVLQGANTPATATKTKLNPAIATAAASGYSSWVSSGKLDLSSFSGTIYIAFRYAATTDANYATWCVDNVKLNAGQGGDTPDTPDVPDTPVPAGDGADFASFNNGELTSTYGTYTNATGWTATWAQILGGQTPGEADTKTEFGFIGAKGVVAVCLNGRTDRQGTLTSPTLAGKCGTLSFNFGMPYADTKYDFTVTVKENGTVKAQKTFSGSTTKQKVESASLEVNASGNFSIEIMNNCPSGNATQNKDRLAIWNLAWTD